MLSDHLLEFGRLLHAFADVDLTPVTAGVWLLRELMRQLAAKLRRIKSITLKIEFRE